MLLKKKERKKEKEKEKKERKKEREEEKKGGREEKRKEKEEAVEKSAGGKSIMKSLVIKPAENDIDTVRQLSSFAQAKCRARNIRSERDERVHVTSFLGIKI